MKLDPEEILKYLCFVILGYFVAMMFSRMCSCGNGYRNGFRVGGVTTSCSTYNEEQCNNTIRCKWTKNNKCIQIGVP